ncbi:helix-turn-helix domain-containing protein [Acetitomaculum ruminis]
MCGYSNASKFTAAFKKYFGITPKMWRQNICDTCSFDKEDEQTPML